MLLQNVNQIYIPQCRIDHEACKGYYGEHM